MCIYFELKTGWAPFWASFSQTRLVTLTNYQWSGRHLTRRRLFEKKTRKKAKVFFSFWLEDKKRKSLARAWYWHADMTIHITQRSHICGEKKQVQIDTPGPMVWFLKYFRLKNWRFKLKNAIFFAKNMQKSQKIVIITSAPGACMCA
jgi:hypothetical protein